MASCPFFLTKTSQMLRALIVEDNATATTVIEKKIVEASAMVSEKIIVQDTLLNFFDHKEHRNYVEASIRMIHQYQPDILFLDIQLDNDDDGFVILREFSSANFSTIIITSFLHLAVTAAQHTVAGIFLKLSESQQLAPIIERAIQEQKKKSQAIKENILVILEADKKPRKINLTKLAYIQASDNYSTCYELEKINPFADHDDAMMEYHSRFSSFRLQDYWSMLSPTTFIQVHKSYIINLEKILSINKRKDSKEKDFEILLQGGKTIPLARSRKDEVFALIQQHKPELLRKRHSPLWMFLRAT